MKRSSEFRAGSIFGMTTSLALMVEQCPPEALQLAGAQLHEEIVGMSRGRLDGQAAALLSIVGDFCLQAAAQKISRARPMRDARDMRGRPQVDDRSVGGFSSIDPLSSIDEEMEYGHNGTEDNLTQEEHDAIDDVNGELAAVGAEVVMAADREQARKFSSQSLVGAGL